MPSRDFPAGIGAERDPQRRTGGRQRQLAQDPVFPPALLCGQPLPAEGSASEIVSLAADILGDFTAQQLKQGFRAPRMY